MKRLTRDGGIENTPLPAVDLEAFLAGQGASDPSSIGVELQPSDDVLAHAAQLKNARFIRLQFPTFREGRPYSQARLLRARIGYTGPIIASGPLMPDQAHFLWRTGFTAVEIALEDRLDTWIAADKRFETYHQKTVGDR